METESCGNDQKSQLNDIHPYGYFDQLNEQFSILERRTLVSVAEFLGHRANDCAVRVAFGVVEPGSELMFEYLNPTHPTRDSAYIIVPYLNYVYWKDVSAQPNNVRRIEGPFRTKQKKGSKLFRGTSALAPYFRTQLDDPSWNFSRLRICVGDESAQAMLQFFAKGFKMDLRLVAKLLR